MAKPYALDLHERVVAQAMAGATVRSAAKTFGVSESSVVKWSQRYRATASAAAKPIGGRRHFVLAGQRVWLLERIALDPSATPRRLPAELAERGTEASDVAVWDFARDEGLGFKKTRRCPASKIALTSPGAERAGSGSAQTRSPPAGVHR